MQVSVESGEGFERRVTVELPAEQVEQEVTKRLKQIGRTAKVDGFRPGKVPMGMLRRQYGGHVLQEVYGELIETSYREAILQEGLHPAGQPKIEPKTSDDESLFSYVATLEIMPVIDSPKVEGTLKRPVADVVDSDVDEMIEKLRGQRITWNPVERAAADGDQVKINFKGIMDGEAFEGGSADDVPLVLGSNSMIDGFESGLVGAEKGGSLTLELQFPEDYRVEELAGKPVTFGVEINEVAESELPEVNDDFAKEFGALEGVEKLKGDIRENMERELEQRIKARIKSQAMDLLVESNSTEVPGALVDEEITALQEQTRNRMSTGVPGSSMELPREMFEEQAKRRVILGLLIAEIIKQNEIQLDADRVRTTIEEYAASYEKPEEVVEHYYGNHEQLAAVQNVVLEDQVVDWVLENAQVEDENTSFSALTDEG
ncbi:MAG: trigger factor [Gammaproteobacteria bacterium (ex Lamellibrachia satsuma)]|nr:MAG: trigger factor [Gammaproteobacteria bacterium (ex Lamellibrachia satsuma)]RRS34565.1 MAG: trigger factor [Gammaproteobacteria bacterium (ex Lamellibrachia satsuma)]RRS37444.1 MAG: trigger factor [Gammaproteobacteria bacterium (ex Lamellibrachia satsuma)]